MKTVFIYGLVDPRTNEVRYVGWAAMPKNRYNDHISETNSGSRIHKCNWIRQLLSLNLEPKLIILDEIPEEDYALAENAWISYGILEEWPLTNATLGGEGVVGLRQSDETKQRLREINLGKILSDETRYKMSESSKGKSKSEDHRINIGKASKGRNVGKKHTEEHNRKIGEKLIGNKYAAILSDEQIIEIKKQLASGEKQIKLAKEYKVNQSTISSIKTNKRWKHLP